MKEIQYGNLDFLQPQNAWEALSQKEKADVMKVAVRRGITDLATIRQMYNKFAEGGDTDLLEYTHQRFPITEDFEVHPYMDRNFIPEGMGNIEYMSANHDTLPYYNNYQKPDSLKGKAAVVYNDRMGDSTKEAVALDILSHGLREQDPTWRKKYLPTLHDAFEGDAIYNMTDKDKAIYNLNDPEEKGEVIDNYIDGYIRDMAVDDRYRKALNYASRKEFNREYNQLPPEQQNALAEAYSYIHPTQLPEITVTGNKHSDGGNLFGGGSYLERAKNLIKSNEGWKSTPYKDSPEGKTWRSVGYGFNDSGFYDKYPEGISKHYEKGITKAQAEEELNWYLNRADRHLRKMYGSKWDTFTDGQKAAILDTYYQRPASVAKGSVFYGNVMSGKGSMTPGVSGYSERNRKRKKAFLGLDTEPYEVPAALQPAQDNTFVFNPYILPQQTALPYPEVVSTPTTLPAFPSEVELEYQRKQQEAAENQYRFNMAMNVLKLLNGEQDPAESFLQNFMPNPSIPLFDGLPEDQYAKGGRIHIKPSHRGRLTELKKRTGKTEAELYRTGSPAVRKMITFARSARKWKHADGGHLFGLGSNLEVDDYPEGYWENRREHAEVKPGYKRTKKDVEYWEKKNKRNAEAAEEFNRKAGTVMSQLSDIAASTPVTGEEVKQAAEDQRQKDLQKFKDYKKGIRALVTAAELGMSGGSLLGAYANWKNWASAANALNPTRLQMAKANIANLLQNAQAPMQVGGTLIDSYQTYDAATKHDDFDKKYNAGSTFLGSAGYLGARDYFRGRYPWIDRALDTAGILQNVGDFIKFGYDTYTGNQKANGGSLHGPVVEAAQNLFYPGGNITLGPRYYMYDKNGQIMRYPDGTPMIQVNASTFPEITIIPDSQKSPADRNEDERFRARTQKDYDEHKQNEWTAGQIAKSDNAYKNSTTGKVLNLGKTVSSGVKTAAEFVPVSGDIIQGLDAAKDAASGNYMSAGLGLGMLAVPNILEKPLKYAGKGLKKLLGKADSKVADWASMDMETLDNAYKAAVESGDQTKALGILEEAYLRSRAPKSLITVDENGVPIGWYHGSEWGNHTIFDSSAMNATIGGESAAGKVKGNFLTTDVPSAMRYAGSGKYTSAEVPEFTSPHTFGEKFQNLFGMFEPRRLYPAERVGEYRPKPERLFDTKGKAPITHMDKVDRVVYPMYVNPGDKPMVLDFESKPWSQSPVKFDNNFFVKKWLRDDANKTYKQEIIPYRTKEEAIEAWKNDPINVFKSDKRLEDEYFDEGERSLIGYNSAPRFEKVTLVEQRVPSTTNGAVQTAAKNGNSSVLMKNVIDSNGGPEGVHYAIDDFTALKPEQMKLADITYDDDGGLIPLIKRFDWSNPDIRYSLESDLKGKPSALSAGKVIRKADSDVKEMNKYHQANVDAYNEATGSNVQSVPFRTDYTGRQVQVLPNEEFNAKMAEFNVNAPSGTAENIGGVYSKRNDTVYLRSTGNPSNNYHEFLHSAKYGETNPEVTRWRISQLVDEDKVANMSPKEKGYYLSEMEAPTHLRQQGEKFNIEVGQEYPGDEAFDELWDSGVGGASYYMKHSTPEEKRLLWKGWNGTLFGLTAPTVITAAVAANSQALGGPIVQDALRKYSNGGNLFLTGGDSDNDNEPGIFTKGAIWLGKKLGIADVFKGKADDTQYRQSIYNGVDPTDAIPNQFGKALQYAGVATRANMGTKFAKNRHHNDPAADAAWAKRLGLPYDKNILIDNGDGSVRLSDSLEAQIPVDTVFLKQRIADNEARLNKVSGPARQHTQYALDYDRDALEALRKTYATGEPVEMNEGSAVGRNWRTNDPERLISPLNLFHRYTIQYDKDKNAMNYWDWYDFNDFENFVPGDPFKIKGSINLNRKRKK